MTSMGFFCLGLAHFKILISPACFFYISFIFLTVQNLTETLNTRKMSQTSKNAQIFSGHHSYCY